ncbi:hypothetical protein V6N12_008710 [Hibiscus sabdariffa]|uniref:RING-CH-type domain-containing protein n=1 Tax=Hibiscus sabdariffa TaxID=183260 RepID=A0ABR2AIX4_9ROSI
MSDHAVLCVDRLTKPESLQPVQEAEAAGSSGGDSSIVAEPVVCAMNAGSARTKTALKIWRHLVHAVAFAHRKCVQRWCDEKGDITCEICHQRLLQLISGKSHNLALETLIFLSFVISVGLVTAIETLISLGPFPVCEDLCPNVFGDLEWDASGASLGYHRILAVTAERHILEPGYDEYSDNDSSGTEFVRAATLTVIALLFLRHALYLTSGEKEDDVSQYICETAAVAVADSAVTIQAVRPQAIHYSIAPEPSATPQQEPLQ